FFEVYAPGHYRPATWTPRSILNFLSLLSAGAAAVWLGRREIDRTSRAILFALLIIVAAGAFFTTIWRLDSIAALFPWRLAPFLKISAIAALSLAIGSLTNRVLRIARPSGLAVLLLLAATMFRHGLWRKDRFGAENKPELASLFAWCRNSTDANAIFAVPPELSAFRLEARRAVVVDWKCLPLLPRDQLEWLRRHEQQSGGLISSGADAIRGYAAMDARRAARLSRDFGAEYIVIPFQSSSTREQGMTEVFRNSHYRVLSAARETHGLAGVVIASGSRPR